MNLGLVMLMVLGCQDYELNKEEEAESPLPSESEVEESDPTETESVATESDTDGAPSCPLDEPLGYDVTVSESCVVAGEAGTFTPVVEWTASTFSTYAAYDNVMATASVADVDGDGIADVIGVFHIYQQYRGYASVLRVLDGASGSEHWSMMGTLGDITGTSGNAVGDVDGDGDVEIFVCTTDEDLLAVDHTGSELWLADGVCTSAEDKPAIHDLDGDGDGEIVVGAMWVDHDGKLIAEGSHGRGADTIYGATSFGADVDGDGVLEIVVGNAVYELDGTALWSSTNSDGHPALGDLEGDGTPDLIVTTPSGMYRYAADTGTVVWGPLTFTGGAWGGPPTIADFDGDGEEEFGVAGLNYYVVYEGDGTELWKAATNEGSVAITGASVFDFEGDGSAEVVYADHETLWVFSGVDGTVRMQWTQHSSGTVSELPVVADVDGDDQAEIVLVSNQRYGPRHGITVFGDKDGSWMDAAPIWNQHAFHRSHVEDDGSLPSSYTPSWQDHRTFRSGTPEGLPTTGIPDLALGELDLCTETCELGEVTVWAAVENRGLTEVSGASLRFTHDGSDVATASVSLDSGEMVWIGPLELTEDDFDLRIAVEGEEDCDTGNDALEVAWPCD